MKTLYFPPQPDERAIFHSIITSDRHRKYGDCDKSDFGTIQLIRLDESEKQLVVSFEVWGGDREEFIEYNGIVYKRLGEKIPHLSVEEEKKQSAFQGRYTLQRAMDFVLMVRSRMEKTYYGVGDHKYILTGKTLYENYCQAGELGVTVDGNLTFSYWLSIRIEHHFNKEHEPLNKKSFDAIVRRERKLFEADKPTTGSRVNDISFSCPIKVKWGEKYRGSDPREAAGTYNAIK